MMRARHPGRALALAALALAVRAPAAAGQRPVARRAPAPAAAPAARDEVRSAADTGTVAYQSAGITVIQRFTAGDIAVANLYLLGGVRQATWESAGLEPFLLEASERGTARYPRDRLRQAMARLGTAIVVDADVDWTALGIRATRATFDSTWAIMASRLMEPTLAPAEVERVREQMVLGVAQRRDAPDALLEYLADSAAFEGHAYALPPLGTEASLGRLGVEALRRYHAAQVVRSRLLLVVVGDVSRARVERLVGATLARLPQGDYRWMLPDTLPHRRAPAVVAGRELPTNYILGRFAGPALGTGEAAALRVTMAVLAGQLFSEVRSRRNLTYAVDAPFVERARTAGGLYVTTVQPELTLDVMRQQLAGLRLGQIPPEGLQRLVRQFLTQFYLDNETNPSQADFLARSWLYEGSIEAVARFERALRAVTPADIQRTAQRLIRDVQWVYLGDASKAPLKAFERW